MINFNNAMRKIVPVRRKNVGYGRIIVKELKMQRRTKFMETGTL